ncbi:MAG: ABC transporter substrate-binding protein [Crocinitomicaceae bacterium]|nr:ABC transporter substrate-binding protein [Crocinitomicaceae bacterium]
MITRPHFFITAIAGIITLFFISCHNGNMEEKKMIFRYNESNGISSLDPAFARELEIMWATNQLFDGLVELDSAMNVVPSIARRWEISDNGLTYTFIIRDSVFFHPSPLFTDSIHRKVTAGDFVYSFGRIMNPSIASPGQWIFKRIDTSISGGIEAPNDSTLVLHLREAFHPFLGMLTTQYCNVVPHEVVEHFGAGFRNHPIGTGPFRFAFWYENVALVFHRFNSYWQKDQHGTSLPYLDAVKIDFVRDMTVEFQGLLQGQYDFISGIHASYKDELIDSEGNLASAYENKITFQRVPFIKTDYLGFSIDPSIPSNKNSPLLDLRIRKALHHAINKEEMVEFLRNNSVFPAGESFIPPGLRLSYLTKKNPTYNPALSQRLLEDAGYPSGQGLPELTISTTGDYADLIEYIQHELQKSGFRIRVQVMQSASLRDATAKNQLPIFRKSWLADYADAENFFSVFYSGNFSPSGPNYTHYANPAFDKLYLQATIEKDDRIRENLYHQLDSIISEDLPVIPLYYDQVSHFIRKGISGFQTNPINMLDLKTVKKEE